MKLLQGPKYVKWNNLQENTTDYFERLTNMKRSNFDNST